ncbi:MAG: thioredoxin-disulfide reductase [Epulopiscium sp.]|nr:thioredoxin-disulfide reductase [Candidatus Epulonipiscium sp.]
MYDLIIIGSGPAGFAAGIYAGRARLKTLLLEKEFAGGQVINTYEVANYPGIPDLSGPELAMKMQAHSEMFGVAPTQEEVIELQLDDKVKKVITNQNTYEAKAIIIATGARWKQLGVPGEQELRGRGVSYCATCDGAFFNGKITAVIGGGDTAVEDAIFLSRYATKVYLIHRRDELRAAKILQEALFDIPNIEILWDTQLKEIKGEQKVNQIEVIHTPSNEIRNIDVDGVFMAIGTDPNTSLVEGKLALDDYNYIIANENCETEIPGVYAAGDVRQKALKQIVTATADGAIAVYAIERYLIENW